MTNGAQAGEDNWNAFNVWVKSKTEADFKQMVMRGVLSRTEISKECNFAKSALSQNPRIKEALRELEERLRKEKILPKLVCSDEKVSVEQLTLREHGGQKETLDAERRRRLENENASLRAENMELKRKLERYVAIHEAVALTGRIPR